jgi:two-component system CheB/CheR fusion protein
MSYATQFFGKAARECRGSLDEDNPAMKELFSLVRQKTQVDLTDYKLPTIRRRIQRNMALKHIASIEDYVERMKKDRDEITFFIKFFLSGISHFFQEPQACSALKEHVLSLMRRKSSNGQVRALSLGCATGEEAYSMAILIEECMEEIGERRPYTVYSTHIDRDVINLARFGIFPSSILVEDVSKERLERFFEKKCNYHRVKSEIRSRVAFSVHNYMETMPHFSIDLVSIRAIAPYLNSGSQRRLTRSLSHSMNHGAILFLGMADSMAHFADLYSTLNPQWKIYSRK